MNAVEWVKTGQHLPSFLRDFHDQKRLFKTIHQKYSSDNPDRMPSWIEAHCYVIDWFLWFMGQRGYTLQKTRKKGVEFLDLMDTLNTADEERRNQFCILTEVLK